MRVSKINLVDLAGSERMKSNNQNITSTETKYINLSLSFLEQVIIALNEKEKGNRNHIPYRNSLMTTILKDSLGGNCKTILIANVSSDIHFIDETMSTMRFALRCAKVQNEISKNEHMDLNILVNKLYNENQDLRNKLEMFQKNQNGSFIINKNYLEILNKELTDFEKDECKILISDYLNDENENKKINASNANQLFFIIDFLIDYIKNKEKKYKKEMTELLQENKELIKLAKIEDEKYKKINEVINKYNLGKYFMEAFIKEKNEKIINNSNNSNIEDKMSIKTDTNINNMNEFISSTDSDNIKNIFINNDNTNLSYNKINYSNMSTNNNNSNKERNNNIPNTNAFNTVSTNYIKKNNILNNSNTNVYFSGMKLKKINSFSKKINNNV
jgi:hypothetical protein